MSPTYTSIPDQGIYVSFLRSLLGICELNELGLESRFSLSQKHNVDKCFHLIHLSVEFPVKFSGGLFKES